MSASPPLRFRLDGRDLVDCSSQQRLPPMPVVCVTAQAAVVDIQIINQSQCETVPAPPALP